MAYRNFPSKTLQELQTELSRVESMLLTGVNTTSGGGMAMELDRPGLEHLKDKIYADLSQLAPDLYPPGAQRVTRTVPWYL